MSAQRILGWNDGPAVRWLNQVCTMLADMLKLGGGGARLHLLVSAKRFGRGSRKLVTAIS